MQQNSWKKYLSTRKEYFPRVNESSLHLSQLKPSRYYIFILLFVCFVATNLFSRDGADNLRAPVSSDAEDILTDSTLVSLLNSDSASATGASSRAVWPDSLEGGASGADTIFSLIDSLGINPADTMTLRRGSQRPKTLFGIDSTLNHRTDTTIPSKIRRTQVDLDNQVVFSSKDSMIMIGSDMTFMYGDGQIDYGELKLTAEDIELNLNTSEVFAVGREDSLGEVIGPPVFEEAGTSYESSTMRYNFNTKRGFITNVITQQGEGYLTGGTTKKTEGEDFYVENGRYTTCDEHDCPHFYLQLTRAKVRPKKNIVTGPAYMVLAGLPLPLAVPFGYFPFTDKYASGVIVPTFGDDYNRGFYLSDGGYYFAINDYVDLALTGEIYTKGSWGLSAQSTYNKRYKFNGHFNINYIKTINGEKGDPDYSTATNFQVIWSHSQDAKSNPNMSLSASVNFTTSGYTRSSVATYYSNAFTENTKSSTVNMTYRFPNSKWSLSTSLNVSQRTQDSTLSVSFPNVNVSMSQTYPFKRKKAVGDEKWYEKIRLSYTGQLQNSLTANQDQFFRKSLVKDWRNGMKHNIPVSATFNLFKYFNLTPSINLTDRMYTTKVRRQWDPDASREICDTTYSFYNVWDFNSAVSLDTKIYGFFQPLPFLGDKVKMIRHVLTPSVSFTYAPDFASPWFGYYDTYYYTDRNGDMQKKTYSMFPSSLYGVPGQGQTGAVSVSLANNLEMKVKTNDSIGEKKISLIENFTISQSYNFAADSMNWSNINTSILLRLTKQFNLNLNATWDVYTYQLNSAGNPVRVNIPRWKAGKGWGRLSSTGTSFSYTFNNDTFKKKSKKGGGNANDSGTDDEGNSSFDNRDATSGRPRSPRDNHNGDSDLPMNDDGYVSWSVPWSLSVNYSINYGYGEFDYKKMEYKGKFTQNLSLSGSIKPTKNWDISATASYDFQQHKIAYMNINISRDMHCFLMRASVIPVGPYKSYNFHIAVKSSLLSDLKYDKRSSQANGVKWY